MQSRRSLVGRGVMVAVTALLGVTALTAPAAAESVSPGGEVPEAAKVATVGVTVAPEPEAITAKKYAEIARKSGDPATKQELQAAVQASGCWESKVTKWGKNVFGSYLWKYHQKLGWCGDGKWITATPKASAWGTTHWPGWTYTGRDTLEKSYGVGWNIWEVSSQGHFCYLDVDNVGCAQTQDPRIMMQAQGDGELYYE
ncbi:hypothetical protein [Streptomyces sp. TR06-5]|uniref:hypothetical protein n=1 Tax=unclassified Streptomyces TaxID=2593676 RepID=UPI0039A3E1AA